MIFTLTLLSEMTMHDQEARVRRIVKVAFVCVVLAIVIALATTVSGQTQPIDPLDSWLPCPEASQIPPNAICIDPPILPTPTLVVIAAPWDVANYRTYYPWITR